MGTRRRQFRGDWRVEIWLGIVTRCVSWIVSDGGAGGASVCEGVSGESRIDRACAERIRRADSAAQWGREGKKMLKAQGLKKAMRGMLDLNRLCGL